jgi:hypothetical protein
MSQLFKLNIRPVILTISRELNQRYILSTDSSDWIAPSFEMNTETLLDLDNKIIKKIKEFVFTNELELMPQLINIKPGSNTNEIDVIYGFIIEYTTSLNNCFWIEFDFAQEKPYSNLILEVAQKLI